MRKIVSAFIPARDKSLALLFELNKSIGFQGLDLLFNLLEINPSKRISAELAL